jgi:hypothetical protein
VATIDVTEILGLHTNRNVFALPEGSAVYANNCVVRNGALEPRRGMPPLTSTISAGASHEFFWYGTDMLVHHNTSSISHGASDGAFSTYSGSYTAPDSTSLKMKSLQARQNFYFNTTGGVYKLDSVSATPELAGTIKSTGLDRDPRVYQCNVNGASLTANVVTVNTTVAHGFYVGQVITQTSATEGTQYVQGNHTVVSVPSSTSFTYAETAANDAGNANVHTYMPAALVATAAWLADGYQVAYRVVFNEPDANNTLNEGGASGRFIIANASGTPGWVTTESKSPVCRVLVPASATVTTRVKLFRSEQVLTTIDPSDDMGQVYEALLTSVNITNGYVDIPDICPDSQIQDTIFISPTSGGIIQNNERPPICKDMAYFQNRAWFANTTNLHRITLNLLAVGTGGLDGGDVITIDNRSYTAVASPSTPTLTSEFLVDTTGSVGTNIRNTAMNLCAVVNKDANNNSIAIYASGENDNPGKIIVERKTLGGPAISPTATVARGAWQPLLNPAHVSFDLAKTASAVVTATHTTPAAVTFRVGEQVTLSGGDANFPAGTYTVLSVTGNTFTYNDGLSATATLTGQTILLTNLIQSTNDACQNRIYYSKVGNPEQVPSFNFLEVGSKSTPIYRIVPLRELLYVFKPEGIYVISSINREPDLLDNTAPILYPDTAQVLGNRIYYFSSQGVVAATESGVSIVSKPVEEDLKVFTTTTLGAIDPTALFACAYETENSYILVSTARAITYVYNYQEKQWTTWDQLDAVCAGVAPVTGFGRSSTLFMGTTTTAIRRDNKALTTADYYDSTVSVTINSLTSTTLTLASASGVAAGDVICLGVSSSTNNHALVTAVNSNTLTVVFGPSASFTTGAATVFKAYVCSSIFNATAAGKPAEQKHFRSIDLTFHHNFCYGSQVGTFSDYFAVNTAVPTLTYSDLIFANRASYRPGTSLTALLSPRAKRVLVPRENQRCQFLSVGFKSTQAFGFFSLNGYALNYEAVSDKGNR